MSGGSSRLVLLFAAVFAFPPPHAIAAEVRGPAELAVVKPVMECAALQDSTVTLPDGVSAKISNAESVQREAGSYCRIRGTISSTIGFEAQLPLNNWSQRYLQVGCGGLCGSIQLFVGNAGGCVPAETGALVLSSTDMGHRGSPGEGEFGSDPQARIDFAYRGVHLTAVAVQRIIRDFYGQAARYSYFSGCSDGGREALLEAQRFPQDFDGIAAGAPAMNFQIQNTFYHAWQALSNTGPDGKAILTAERLPLLHRAAVASCDALDGLQDGQIADPRQCRFDPSGLLCQRKDGATDDCLTAAEVAAAQALYRGAHTANAERLVIGGPQVGSELSWAGVFVPRRADETIFSSRIALGVLRHVAFETNPTAFALTDLEFDRETFERLRPLHALYDATDPNLRLFSAHGGKLILWHGWSDPHISPINTIAYFESLQRELGETATDGFARLFLFPGMYHCAGGDGPSQFDVLTPLMSWVERGAAPAQIVAGRPVGMLTDRRRTADGQRPVLVKSVPVDRTRPIYPYPAVASYRGSGSLDDANSFVSKPGVRGPASYDWVGRSFMTPGFQRSCVVKGDRLDCPANAPRQ
jgi:feruloyl esterase